MKKQRTVRRDRYNFGNCISYFKGGGTRPTSKSARVVFLDEIDDFTEYEGRIGIVKDARKRMRSFDDSLMILVCTPTVVEGPIWQEYLDSSQGVYHLRCQHCDHLSIPTNTLINFQFECVLNEDDSKTYIEGSSRIVCPLCGYQHDSSERDKLIDCGGYVHKFEDKILTKPGFQAGVLASKLSVFDWDEIAKIRLQCGRSADLKDKVYFDNSILGIPYVHKYESSTTERDKLLAHCRTKEIDGDSIEAIFLTADTQDDRSVYLVTAVDVNNNFHVLEYGETKFLELDDDDREVENQKLKQSAAEAGEPYIPIRTLEDVLKTEYFQKNGVGIKILFGLVDSGGHRTNEVYRFVAKHKNLWNFKGNGAISTGDRYKISKDKPKLLLGKSKEFQSDLIYYLYTQRDRRSRYLTLPPENTLSDQFIDQIICVKPNPTVKFGHLPINWAPQNNQQHDFFDVLKYFFVIFEFCVDKLPKDKWRFGKADAIIKRWKDVKPKKKIDETTISKQTNGWI